MSHSLQRLLQRVERIPGFDCWIWMGWTKAGYGHVWEGGGKTRGAHRVIWELTRGPIPPGLVLCHKCDVPLCVNPDHLFVGTHRDNAHDCIRKGRYRSPIPHLPPELRPRGERIGSSKLTAEQARRVKFGREPAAALARELGIKEWHVYRIRAGLAWAHIGSDS